MRCGCAVPRAFVPQCTLTPPASQCGPRRAGQFYGNNEKFHATLEEDGSYQMDQNAKHKPKLEGEALAEAKRKAWARGVPISKQEDVLSAAERFADHDKISLVIVSEMHKESEYGIERTPEGGHCGGPFRLKVSPECTVRDLMLLIRDAAGIMPGLQKLSYRGVHMDDLYRRLEQYGVAYWHKKFPDWPITIRNQ